eukprot:9021960-Lingulodinium_polyedra.AAC.1
MAATLILEDTVAQLRAEGLTLSMVVDADAGPCVSRRAGTACVVADVSYVDDDLFIGIADTPQAAVEQLRIAAQCVQ